MLNESLVLIGPLLNVRLTLLWFGTLHVIPFACVVQLQVYTLEICKLY